MAQQPEAQIQLFHYENVQILKDKCLGIGSYGAVYKAKCGELFCAAKILHPTIVPPGTRNWITDKFEQECNFLSNIRHPHIVLCLGVTTDPESGLKVLLMELMDESLTKFLEQSEKPLPYHIQVKLCHDIVLALVFLHSNDIIHRDLSSNNVLLIAGSRAKITDFGMSRLANVGPHMTPFTQCPGTQVYMPPEALKVRPVYTQKLDCFSFGVVGLQILTCLFPEPSDSERIVEDSKFRTGTLKVLVPELERRKNHIDLIDPNHPLLAVTLDCLKDKEKERPTAQELCRHLFSLKESPQYIESERESRELTMGSMVRRERQIKEQCDQKLQELQLQQEAQKSAAEAEILQVQEELQHKNTQVQEQQRQLQQLQGQLGEQREQLREQQGQLREYQTQLQLGTENQKPQLQQSITRSCPTISERVTRDDIVNAIREIKILPGQQLRHVEVSKDIYDMANMFARWAPNFGPGGQPYRFKMDYVYQLLKTNIRSRSLQEATEEVEGWQSACKALLRYALNLLLAPKRPEFRRLKLSSSFYVYQVLRKLPKGAEKILVFMGYKSTSQDMQELKYEGDVNTDRVLETAADLVILHSELDLVKELLQVAINKSQRDTYVANFITLRKILDVRALTDEKYDDTWTCLIKAAYTLQDAKNQLAQPGKLLSERPSSDITAYGNRAQNLFPDARQDYRRGSSPALNQWPDNQTSASNQSTDLRTSAFNQNVDLCRGSVPVGNVHPQLQFERPTERLVDSAGNSQPSPSLHQVPQQAVPHHQYPPSGPQVVAPLQSRDPGTASKQDPATHHDLLHQQAAMAQGTQQCQPLSGSYVGQNPHHHRNVPHSTVPTSSSECTHQSQPSSSDSSSVYQNVQFNSGNESSRGEDNRLYANIRETAVDQGVPTGQSPTAQHKQRSPQEVKVAQTPGATPSKVHTSVSSRSFQEELHKLYKQFPDLLESQGEGPAPSTSDPTYQNIGDVLQLEGETEKPQESLAPDTLNLPEPVAQSEAELEQYERYRQNQSGLMSINPGIKDARSVIDDDSVGPCYDSLSPPDRSLAHTPSAQDQQYINEAWTVRTETHPVTQFLIGAGNEGSTSDRLPSHSSSGTEDIYESGGGSANVSLEQESSLASLRNKPASPSDVTLEVTDTKPVETSGSASVEYETLTGAITQQTVPHVVADCDDNSLPEPQPLESKRPLLQHQGTIPESGSKLKPVPKPRNKLQDMHKTSKSLDNEVEEEPKSPQPKPRTRGRMRNVKSASDLQQLDGQRIGDQRLNVPSAQPEMSDEDEGDNVTPGEVQPTTCDRHTGQQDGVQQSVKPVPTPRQPLQGASTETESVLSDNTTSDREGVNMRKPVATGTDIGEENGETGKDGREYLIRNQPPISPLQGKTLPTVLESPAMARNPDQVPVRDQVNKELESTLDFGGQRTQHQKTSSSSRTKDMPSPQDLVVGQTDLADPVVEGFWFCSYCTNLVSKTSRVCDVCGADQDAV